MCIHCIERAMRSMRVLAIPVRSLSPSFAIHEVEAAGLDEGVPFEVKGGKAFYAAKLTLAVVCDFIGEVQDVLALVIMP
tara:strand:- start:572 stop:808 length:237 start_codon:yes stop_codon:yes gene_type:complete